MIWTVAVLPVDAPALSVAVHPAWMLVGVDEMVEKVCDVPATKGLVAGDRHWYEYGGEPPDTLHENVTFWLIPAGFGLTETLTESAPPPHPRAGDDYGCRVAVRRAGS